MTALVTTARKALVAALAAFLSALYLVVQSGQDVTLREVASCALAGVLAGLATYQVPNAVPDPQGDHAADR